MLYATTQIPDGRPHRLDRTVVMAAVLFFTCTIRGRDMAVSDIVRDNSVAAASRQVRDLTNLVTVTAEQALNKIAELVSTHGKNALAEELGGDGPDFAAFFDNARALVLTQRPSTRIPTRASLPA